MLVNLGKCNNIKDLEALQAETKEKSFNPTPPRETVKTQCCEIYFNDNDNLKIDKIIKVDFSDKDFILFYETGGKLSAYRRDEIKEIYLL